MRVDILLATYNGARFLEDQLRCVLGHLGPDCRLLVRDDGSADATLPLLYEHAARADGRIVLLEDGDRNLGACGNFARLLEYADADYVMFCDQDDVWLPTRISATLGRIQEIEREHGADTPVLVHTDLAVVDEDLRMLSPSFWRYSRLDPRRGGSLNRLLVQNVVTGCATTINRSLAELARPIPREAAMHDWWLALVAAARGRLEFLPQATVLYRQHAGNRIGAARWGWSHIVRQTLAAAKGEQMAQRLHAAQQQAAALLQRFAAVLSPAQRATIQALVELNHSGFIQRRRTVLRYGLLKAGWLRNLGWLVGI